MAAFFNGRNTWQSQGSRPGLYAGCGRTSHRNCCSFSRVFLTEMGLALSRWSVIPHGNVPGLRLYFIPQALQSFAIAVGIDSDALALPVYQQRSTTIEEQCQHHLTSVGDGTTLFRSERLQMFPLLTRAFRPWIIVQTPGLAPPTKRSRNLSPSLSHRSTYSQQIPMRVAFCSSFKLLGTHTAQTFRYPKTSMTMWCTCSTLMPRCSLIRGSVTRRSHCTIWSNLPSVSGSATWGGRPGRARSSVLLPLWTSCTSQTPLYAAVVTTHMLHVRMNVCWSFTFRTKKMDCAALCVSGRIHDCPELCNTHLCRHDTEQLAYDVCLSRSVVNTVRLDENSPTIQVVRLFIIQPLHNPSIIDFALLRSSVYTIRQIPKVKPKEDSSNILKSPNFCQLTPLLCNLPSMLKYVN